MKNTGAKIVTTIFLCHNCSDINSPSGEACILRADISRKESIISGKHGCLKGYTVINEPLQKELGDGGLISSAEFPVETDFYLVQSEEAKNNYEKVSCSPMWETDNYYLKFTEDDLRIEKEYEDRLKESQRIARERRISNEISRAHELLRSVKACTLETDPLNKCGMVR